MAKNTENPTHLNRLTDIAGAIEGARKAIQNWEDKRTEALIDLDALSYDIRLLEDEKVRAIEVSEQYKSQFKNQERIYQAHVESFSDQLQEAKIENETLRSDLRDAKTEIETARNELQNQIQIQKSFELQQGNIIAQARAELEIQLSDLQYKYENQMQEMTLRLQSTYNQKSEAEVKAKKLEHDLQAIRRQMMSALNTGDVVTNSAVVAASIDTVKNSGRNSNAVYAEQATKRAAQNALASNSGNQQATQGVAATSNSSANENNQLESTPSGTSAGPELLQDYLKRLGY